MCLCNTSQLLVFISKLAVCLHFFLITDRNSVIDIEMEVEEDGVKMRRISTDSGEESADSSRRSSRSSVYRRRSSHLSEFISDQKHKSDSDINADNITNIEDLEIDSNNTG